MGILTVHLDRITNLADEDHIGQSDPYVKFELEQDNAFFDKDFGEMISTKKKDEQNPVYGEDFHFNIPTLNNMELTVKVMDDDIGRDESLGKCKIKLEDLDLSDEPQEIEKKVDNNIFSADAYIYLKLSYTE
mmetsp:Transcript_10276/g.18539  ORF Transcript_10276/g.18539 Transcript_10276/m.18539 type:complete len:132 (-) Transcript_10276:146-541(-)|eukprot:CAMPEP_0201866916 /NCGR_PEP_ID=MMETSP0902-20130614/1328_1 /ASSEMBLY_ACC=CAM_ASM_000551 /TAXON_ID=420261 /ORGANISM="Thalassiosira antarctica, Strain CCMP982" /LENGTH=131 /DNA_ID=CAMNT_0048391967 /DNA_START=200 /DNA_END=595 /DNA_ORIENTATION=+